MRETVLRDIGDYKTNIRCPVHGDVTASQPLRSLQFFVDGAPVGGPVPVSGTRLQLEGTGIRLKVTTAGAHRVRVDAIDSAGTKGSTQIEVQVRAVGKGR